MRKRNLHVVIVHALLSPVRLIRPTSLSLLPGLAGYLQRDLQGDSFFKRISVEGPCQLQTRSNEMYWKGFKSRNLGFPAVESSQATSQATRWSEDLSDMIRTGSGTVTLRGLEARQWADWVPGWSPARKDHSVATRSTGDMLHPSCRTSSAHESGLQERATGRTAGVGWPTLSVPETSRGFLASAATPRRKKQSIRVASETESAPLW